MNEWVMFGLVAVGSILALGLGSWVMSKLGGSKKDNPKA